MRSPTPCWPRGARMREDSELISLLCRTIDHLVLNAEYLYGVAVDKLDDKQKGIVEENLRNARGIVFEITRNQDFTIVSSLEKKSDV